MPKVTGIGGIVFKAKGDPKVLAGWYHEERRIPMTVWSIEEPQASEYGTFASFLVPEGNKVDLWEPAAARAR